MPGVGGRMIPGLGGVSRTGAAYGVSFGAALACAVAIQSSMLLGLALILLALTSWHVLGVRRTRLEHVLFYLLVFIYTLLAALNSFVIDLPGTMPDSWTFHRLAADYANDRQFYFGVDYLFYANILAPLYYMTSSSYFLASTFSVLAMALALIFVIRLSEELSLGGSIHWVFLICGLMPTFLLLGPAPMREALQVMLLTASIYYGSFAIRNNSMQALVMMIVASILFGMLHKAMLFFALFMICLYAVLFIKDNVVLKTRHIGLIGILLGASFLLVLFIVMFTRPGRELVAGLFKLDMFWSIWYYRTNIDDIGDPGSAYDVVFNHGNPVAALLSVAKVYLYYMFYPFLPQDTPMDIKSLYAVAEVWLRTGAVLLVVASFSGRWRPLRRTTIALLVLYLAMSFTWSLGTTNYGQAVRHHVLDNWILVILVVEAVSRWRSRRIKEGDARRAAS